MKTLKNTIDVSIFNKLKREQVFTTIIYNHIGFSSIGKTRQICGNDLSLIPGEYIFGER